MLYLRSLRPGLEKQYGLSPVQKSWSPGQLQAIIMKTQNPTTLKIEESEFPDQYKKSEPFNTSTVSFYDSDSRHMYAPNNLNIYETNTYPSWQRNIQPIYLPSNFTSAFSQTRYSLPNCQIEHSEMGILSQMCQVINDNGKTLQDLLLKSDQQNRIIDLIYKKVIAQPPEREQTLESKPSIKNNFPVTDEVTGPNLIEMIYGSRTQFKYSLVLDSKTPLQLPLYREKNFSLKVNLIDQNNKVIANTNKIPLQLALYTVEQLPKFVDCNTRGNKMLRGFTEQDLINGVSTFDKLQIKSVTSHFKNGMLFLVVYPKEPSPSAETKHHIDYKQIKPLVIERIVVRAKKLKQCSNKVSDSTLSNQKQEAGDFQSFKGMA